MAETTNIATQRAENQTLERSAEEIRQDIAAKRETISQTVDKLGERIHETLDWREYVTQYPAVTLGIVAGLGFLVAGIFKRRPTPQQRIADAVAELTEELTGRLSDIASDTLKKKLVSGKTVKAALTGVVTKAAMDYAKNQVNARLLGGGREDENRQATSRGQRIAQSMPPIH
jgi:hypothetical protein